MYKLEIRSNPNCSCCKIFLTVLDGEVIEENNILHEGVDFTIIEWMKDYDSDYVTRFDIN